MIEADRRMVAVDCDANYEDTPLYYDYLESLARGISQRLELMGIRSYAARQAMLAPPEETEQ